MPINLEDLKGVLASLEISPDAIDAIVALDAPAETLTQADVDAAVAASDAAWTDRYRQTFFAPAEEVSVVAAGTSSEVSDEGGNTNIDIDEDVSIDDILTNATEED